MLTATVVLPLTGLAGRFGPVLPGLVVALAAAGLVGYFVYQYRRRRAKRASVLRLVARMPGWYPTGQPCGVSAEEFAGRSAATPRGDRRFGIRYGIGGPMELDIGGHGRTCDVGLFQWFSEERSTSRSSNGTSNTTYSEKRQVVGVTRLPLSSSAHVSIGPESLFGRIGLTRGGDQVESSEFNRRFRVSGRDRTLTVQLLDANLQHVLLRDFEGRTIDLDRQLLVLGGRPDHRDDSLTGVVGEFPAVREDLARLVRELPAQFWRAAGVPSTDEEA